MDFLNEFFRKMFITVNKKDRMYMPKDVSVFGGDNSEDIDELNKITIKPLVLFLKITFATFATFH